MSNDIKNNPCKLYTLVKSLSGCKCDSPEGTLYGTVMLMSAVTQRMFDFMLADYGIILTAKIREQLSSIEKILNEYNIDGSLVKFDGRKILPVLDDITMPDDGYCKLVKRYVKGTSLERIIRDAIETIISEGHMFYTRANNSKDIDIYRLRLIREHGLEEKYGISKEEPHAIN